MEKPVIVLLSGGLDSATVLALVRSRGKRVIALSFAYGQRHQVELDAAHRLADAYEVAEHRVVQIDLRAFGGSALTDDSIAVPASGQVSDEIPVTYVPARNTIFLSYALALAEVSGAEDIYLGVNAVDYSGYPDCRPEYIRAYEAMAGLALKSTVSGRPLRIHTPLIDLSKAEIIKRGAALGVDYSRTVSCYQADADGRACGRCDSCRFRRQGFLEAGLPDPTRYQ